jgi:hypothetical protein
MGVILGHESFEWTKKAADPRARDSEEGAVSPESEVDLEAENRQEGDEAEESVQSPYLIRG